MKAIYLSILTLLLLTTLNFQSNPRHSVLGEKYAREFLTKVNKGKGSFLSQVGPVIKDQETAVAIAEAILFKIYGKDNITRQRPYEVYQISNHWVLFGTLPEGYHGGVFEIAMDARDGRIIGLSHGK